MVLCGVVVGVTPPSRARRRRRIYKTLKTFKTNSIFLLKQLSLTLCEACIDPYRAYPGLTRHFILMNKILVSNKMLHFKEKLKTEPSLIKKD